MQKGESLLYSTNRNFLKYFFLYLTPLVIIFIIISNPQVTNAQFFLENYLLTEKMGMLVGTSETVRMFSNSQCSKKEHNKGNDDTDLKVRQ